MNKKIYFLLISILTISSVYSKTYTNKTFLSARPAGVNMAMQMCNWLTFATSDPKDRFGINYQVTPFYEQSTNGSRVGKYFTFDGKKELHVKINSDVHPYNFNLRSEYDGYISFSPRQIIYGERIDYYTNFRYILKGLYFSVSLPIVTVSNNPRFKERVITTGAQAQEHPGPYTVTEAVRGADLTSDWSERWEYGKIIGKKSKTGLADTDVKLGYKIFDKDKFKFSITAALTFPTGNKAEGVYLFEPIVGNGGHWAPGAGLDLIWKFWQNQAKKYDLSFVLAADYRYLLENEQVRAIGLKNKNWGHFIRMRKLDPFDTNYVLANSMPGINVMTREVKVRPGSQFDGIASLALNIKKLNFELGYNLYARQSDRVKLHRDWYQPGYFALDSGSDPFNRPLETTADNATDFNTVMERAYEAGTASSAILNYVKGQIFPASLRYGPRTVGANNYGISSDTIIGEFKAPNGDYITTSDIDLSAASSPSAITHKIYGGVSLNFSFKKQPTFLSLGGSYEFAPKNNSFAQWAIWGKLGISL